MEKVPNMSGSVPKRGSRLPRRLALDQLLLARWRKPRLLIVDDDDDLRELVRVVAQSKGYKAIWEAPDGESAIAVVYEHQPEVIVLDYWMPRMNGEAVAKCIRLLSPDSVIIAFSTMLDSAPEWADQSFDKTQLDQLVEALVAQVGAPAARSRRNRGVSGDLSESEKAANKEA